MNAREATINYPDRGWINAMDRPGAYQVGYLKKFMESRPPLNRIPDNSIILQGQDEKGEFIQAFRSADNSYTMIYLPVGKTITVSTKKMAGQIVAWWFDPKNASLRKVDGMAKKYTMEFTSPTSGIGNDWVLIMDDASRGFKAPWSKVGK